MLKQIISHGNVLAVLHSIFITCLRMNLECSFGDVLMVVMGSWLEQMILEVFSNLYDSVIAGSEDNQGPASSSSPSLLRAMKVPCCHPS